MKRILFCTLVLPVVFFGSSTAQEIRDPVKEAARAREKQFRQENYRDLKEAATELLNLSKELNDEVEKSGEHVVSARIFDKLDKIDKTAKRIRDKARGPY